MKIGGLDLTPEFKPVGFVDTSLGKLAIFSISAGDQGKVMGDGVKAIEPSVLAKRLIPFIAHPADVLGEDELKPAEPTLSAEQVDTLGENDIDSILVAYIPSQEHLYRKNETQESKDEEGRTVVRFTYGDIIHPKREDESNSQYLHRLYALEEERMERQLAALTKNITQFSGGLQNSIKNTLQMGNSLSKLMESVRHPTLPDMAGLVPNTIPKPTVVEPSLPSIDYEAIAKDAEEARWAPFNAVNERLDTLVDLTASSGEFMVQMNQTQTQIASEIRASGEEASKIGIESLTVTRWGFYTTIVVLLLTIAGLVLSEMDRRQGSDNAEFLRQQAEQFVSGQQQLSETISSDRKAAAADLRTIVSQMEKNRNAQSQSLEAILDSQAALIKQQAEDRLRDQKTIDELRRKLSELEARIEDNESADQSVEDETTQTTP